jgi:redox-regulated HSP33 family molecular chaperone
MPTGAYFEPKTASNGAGALGVELHLVAQAVCWRNTTVDYVADAYSCGFEAQVLTGTEELEHVERVLELRETVRELLETPEPADDVITSVNVFQGQRKRKAAEFRRLCSCRRSTGRRAAVRRP